MKKSQTLPSPLAAEPDKLTITLLKTKSLGCRFQNWQLLTRRRHTNAYELTMRHTCWTDCLRYMSVCTVNMPKVKLTATSVIKQNNAVVNEVSLHQNRLRYEKSIEHINKVLSKNFTSCFQNCELRHIDLSQLINSLCVFICWPVRVFKWQWLGSGYPYLTWFRVPSL